MEKSGIDLFEELKKKRKKIDLIDRKLLHLLNERLRIALEVGNIKKKMGEKIYDPRREEEVLEGIRKINRGPLREEDLEKIFKTIMSVCRRSQT